MIKSPMTLPSSLAAGAPHGRQHTQSLLRLVARKCGKVPYNGTRNTVLHIKAFTSFVRMLWTDAVRMLLSRLLVALRWVVGGFVEMRDPVQPLVSSPLKTPPPLPPPLPPPPPPQPPLPPLAREEQLPPPDGLPRESLLEHTASTFAAAVVSRLGRGHGVARALYRRF